MVLTGYVLGTNCQPIKGAWLDFWQADNNGQYDNSGFKMRGYQLTDDSGKFTLETAVPGLYPGRTRHIHVKVRAPNQPILTTQLYFPGEARNQNDGIYRKELEMQTKEANGVLQATFNFVLKIN
jgi:protocatechuate 3,4-dioxygenase beta subunit